MYIEIIKTDAHGAELLINELSHRWLNYLTIVSLRIEGCSRNDQCTDALRQDLSRILDQIQSMAALHRRLSRLARTSEPVEEYCRAVCSGVMLSFGRNDISLQLRMCDAPISPGCLLRVAILIAELLANALKHGKAPPVGGTIWILMQSGGDGWLELSFSDNFGPPDFAEPPRPVIVDALVKDLSGELDVRALPGYLTKIRFPIG
jgi:two-component sensor histidine kinase